jgi:legumain
MFLALTAVASAASPYVILYAGSNTWSNYRHQADIYTFYTILTQQNGLDPSQIVLAAYDDLATSTQNPYSGKIFHATDHKVNVFPGSAAINYRQKTVTADLFYQLASTLPTTSEDYVFVYYDDHGDDNILGVPDGNGDYIYGDKLAAAFKTSASAGVYKALLFGVEACYAGTTGEQLPTTNFATLTASNAEESSYAAVYDSQLSTYLSNEFTNYWLAELTNSPTETVGELFDNVKALTQESHATWYGDQSLRALPISLFVGSPKGNLLKYTVPEGIRKVSPKVAAEEALAAMSESRKPEVRARARIAKLDAEYLTQRLEIVLDEIVRAVDIKNYLRVQKPIPGKTPESFYEVQRHFLAKFGRYNLNDAGRMVVLKNLCRTHTASEIIAAIDGIL